MPAVKQKTKSAEAFVARVKMTREKQVRAEIVGEEKTIEKSYVVLARLLFEVQHEKYWHIWKYDSFEDYADSELTMGRRKAFYLAKVWNVVDQAGLKESDLENIEWSKMREITKVMNAKNAKDLLAKAEKMSRRELIASIKRTETKDTKGHDLPTVVTLTMRMENSEHEAIEEAIKVAKQICKTKEDPTALQMICLEWMEFKGAKPEVTDLETHIKYLEKVYPVKITFEEISEKGHKKTEEKEKVQKVKAKDKGNGKGKPSPSKEPDELSASEEWADDDINSLLGNSK